MGQRVMSILIALTLGIFLVHCSGGESKSDVCTVSEDCDTGDVCNPNTKKCVLDPQCFSTNTCVSDRTKEICDRLVDCGSFTNLEECMAIAPFEGMVLSDACMKAFFAAPCSEYDDGKDPSSYSVVCWESCTEAPLESIACQGANLSMCLSGRKLVLDCEFGCLAGGTLFSGVCGKASPSGETSETDTCWCE
jgi:hypothetical protein